MNISELSIRRPVLATVLTVIIILFGIIGYQTLGVREYPSVEYPIVTVSSSYSGANADVIENQVTEPLEQEINGIPGIRTMNSTSQQGYSYIKIEFELSVDMETAANDVRDKVSRAQKRLPDDCDAPTISKADSDTQAIIAISLNSEKRSLLEISEIADLTVKQQLQTINGVSGVTIMGEKQYAMRLWLDPVKMAGYAITPMDVKQAIDRENVELPSGSIEGNTIELSIRTMGQISTMDDFNNLIVKHQDGKIIRLSDIGRADLSASNLKSYLKMNGVPMVSVGVVPQPGANHIEIADEVYKRMEMMKKDMPEDMQWGVTYDTTQFIRSSIDEVKDTIYIALILVVIIIFLFLRDWRVTLVPCIVIPVSLIGSFFVMYIAGFSINVLTMLAIVLAVGLVVDDAIVMTENIYLRIEKGMKPFDAGIEGAKEIFFAVISTTVTLVAVFLPIVFMDGMTGRLFREFSMVISGAVIISSFTALTITPMLATKLLKKHDKQSKFYEFTEPFFVGLNNLYAKALGGFMRRRYLAVILVAISVGAISLFMNLIPSEMAPMEDRSQIRIFTRGAEAITYEYMRDYTEDITSMIDSLVPDAESVLSRVLSNSGFIRIGLKDLKDRDYTQMELAEKISREAKKKTMARSFIQQQSSLGSGNGSMAVQYVLQATTMENMEKTLPLFMEQVSESKIFEMSDVDLKFSKPEQRININREKANTMGVSTKDIAQTLQYGLSGQRMGYFYMNGKQYSINADINRQQRNKPSHLKSIYVRNSSGEMIPLDNLIEVEDALAPPKIYHYNRFISATVSAGLSDGYSLGDGIEEMDRIAKQTLDDTFRTSLTGQSKNFSETASSLLYAFVFALLLIYLILAAQFESFKDPFVIMLTVPLAVSGALVGMYFFDITMNIFSQIGIIMLIGLVAKNGILIVEFANQKQEEGLDKFTAIKEASQQRLRPILMTSASTVLGLIPLAMASGEGCNQRIAMGITVVSGLLVSTVFTMFVIPAVYSFVSTNRNKKEA
ncbi:MAG: efflux RND transporter permease subunit [Rikenellaceae bacterium]